MKFEDNNIRKLCRMVRGNEEAKRLYEEFSGKAYKAIMERVEDFDDIREELGAEHPLCECLKSGADMPIMAAFAIAEALNEGWEPTDAKYYVMYRPITDEDYNNMNEKQQEECVISGNKIFKVEAYLDWGYYEETSPIMPIPISTAFYSSELARFAGKKFSDIYLAIYKK